MARTMQDQLIEIVEAYREAGQEWPSPKRTIASWAVANRLYQMEKETVIGSLANKLGDAMRKETHVDPDGNEVRTYGAYVMSAIDGDGKPKQQVMWADMRDATRDEKEAAVALRLRSSTGDVRRLCIDVHSYNKHYRRDSEPLIELRAQLDFRGVWDQTLDERDSGEGSVA